MAGFPIANPEVPQNKAALEMTQMQLAQAKQMAGGNADLVPALVIALALNKQSLMQHSDAKK